MQLEFKQDFERARKNWQLMWEGKLNRPIMKIIIPKEGKKTFSKPNRSNTLEIGFENFCDQTLLWAESHEFLGDAVPFQTPYLKVGILEALMGAKIELAHEPWGLDSHVIPCVKDLSDYEWRLHRESEWWEKWVKLVEIMKHKLTGKIIFGEGFPGGNLDQLSGLRGTTEFMMDFFDNPEGVHHAMREMQKVFDEFHDENKKLMEYDKYGSVTRHGFYSTGIAGVPQSDAAFSIGKEHFDEFGLPYLKQEIARLDAVEYHLDGIGNLTHLESICKIKEIGIVQWVPGAGTEGRDWTSLYEDITRRGKGICFGAATPQDAVELWNKYGYSNRMVISCQAKTKTEAEAYLKVFDC